MDQPFDSRPDLPLVPAEGEGWQELTIADAIRLIAADAGLTADRKRHWLTSLRRLAAGIGRPPASIPARLTSLRHPLSRLNAARMGIEEKSLANHRSNVLAAVRYVLKVTDAPRRGQPLSHGWEAILPAAPIKPRRLLSGLARYCSSRGIGPGVLKNAIIADYFVHRERTTFLEAGTARLREVLRAWNACVGVVPGWPDRHLDMPELSPRSAAPAWEDFPEGLRADIEAHLLGLARPHRTPNGRRRRACKRSTVETRRRELLAFARKAVAAGIPIERLSSLRELLAPEVVERTFEAYLAESGDRPSVFAIDLGWKLHALAREIGAPEEAIARLDEIREVLEDDRPAALTEKNLTVIRAVLASDIWNEVTALPARLMRAAELQLNRSTAKAASTAALAIQILILTRAPIRVGNLLAIKLGVNLVRPGGDRAPFHLTFPDYDVKNRVDLEFPMSVDTSELIQRYVDLFRHYLPGSRGSDWLFPGEQGRRSASHASVSIADRVEREVGLRVTAHQFRHAAAAVILKNRPGEYEFVRRVLGHRNVQTTMKYYTALEAFSAGEHFAKIIEDRLRDDTSPSSPSGRRNKKP